MCAMPGRQLRGWYRNGRLKGCFYSCSQQPVVRKGGGATLPLLFRGSYSKQEHPSERPHSLGALMQPTQEIRLHGGLSIFYSLMIVSRDLSIGPTLPALVCGSGPHSMTETFCPSPLLSIFPQLSICSESPKHVLLAVSTHLAHS